MALRRNSILACILIAAAGLASPVLADDETITGRSEHRSNYLDDNYIYDYMTHRDSITIGLGDAPTSNIIIQHPTPWPSYINNTRIKTPAVVGVSALDNMMERLSSGGGSVPTSTPGAVPMGSSTAITLPSAASSASGTN